MSRRNAVGRPLAEFRTATKFHALNGASRNFLGGHQKPIGQGPRKSCKSCKGLRSLGAPRYLGTEASALHEQNCSYKAGMHLEDPGSQKKSLRTSTRRHVAREPKKCYNCSRYA